MADNCFICTEKLGNDSILLPCCKASIHIKCWESWPVEMCPRCRNTDIYEPPPLTRSLVLKNYAEQIWTNVEVNAFNNIFNMKGLTPRVWVKIVYFEGYIDGAVLKKIEEYFKNYCKINRKNWLKTSATIEDLQLGMWHSLLYAFDLLDQIDD